MAEWTETIDLTEPAAFGALKVSLFGEGGLVDGANATMNVASGALNVAKAFLTGTVAPEAAAASALVTEAQNLVNDIFGAGFAQLVVHPWTPGVGRGDGVWRHLDFPRTLSAISASFDDLGDDERPQYSSAVDVEMIALVVGSPSPSIFKSTLEALNALLNAKELRLAIRRIAQAFELEAERFGSPIGSRPPDWDSVTVREAFPALGSMEDSLVELLAMLEGYAAGSETAVDIALALIATKQAQLTALQNNLNAASALFGQGLDNAGVYALHTSGVGGNAFLQSEIKNSIGAPSHELSFCAAVTWVAPAGGLTPLADLLGI